MSRIGARVCVALVAAVGIAIGSGVWSPAQAAPAGPDGSAGTGAAAPFVSFDSFLSGVSGAQFQSRAGGVANPLAFNQMRSYVLDMYRGVKVTQSYFDNDSYFDCVVTDTQPSVRTLGTPKLATPPGLSAK